MSAAERELQSKKTAVITLRVAVNGNVKASYPVRAYMIETTDDSVWSALNYAYGDGSTFTIDIPMEIV